MKKIGSDVAKVFQNRIKYSCLIELNNEVHSSWYKYHKVSYDVPWSLSFSGHQLYFSDVCVGFCLVFVSGRLFATFFIICQESHYVGVLDPNPSNESFIMLNTYRGSGNSYLFQTVIFVDCISQTTIEH